MKPREVYWSGVYGDGSQFAAERHPTRGLVAADLYARVERWVGSQR
jgi:hypothetical protein